jgi:hypothetical protein
MTLVLTILNRYGIIHASDSALTSDNSPAGEDQKTFPVYYLNAGLTVAGVYSVGGISMNQWMNDFINKQASLATSPLSKFAKNLKAELEAHMDPEEKEFGSFTHIAGYVEESGRSHPEFWFVRNVSGIDPSTGDYTGITLNFAVTEDFWTRDCPKNKMMESFEVGNYFYYINGYPDGRIAYNELQKSLSSYFLRIWFHPNWKFRSPKSISESKLFAELNLQTIITLFRVSDYPAPYIGGRVQSLEIPSPSNVVSVSPPMYST